MSKNIVDFNEYKAAKESAQKSSSHESLSFEIPPISPEMMNEIDSDAVQDMLINSFNNLFLLILKQAAEYETYDDYLDDLHEALEVLLESEPKSKKSKKYIEWFSQVSTDELSLQMAISIGEVISTGKKEAENRIPLLEKGMISEADLGIKLPIESNDDILALDTQIDQLINLERNGQANEADIERKTLLLTLLIMLGQDMLEVLYEDEPRKAKKTQHRKWEESVCALRFNIYGFYYLCGSSFTSRVDDDYPKDSYLTRFLSALQNNPDESEPIDHSSVKDVLDYITSFSEEGCDMDDEDYDDEEYDDDYFDFFEADDGTFVLNKNGDVNDYIDFGDDDDDTLFFPDNNDDKEP